MISVAQSQCITSTGVTQFRNGCENNNIKR